MAKYADKSYEEIVSEFIVGTCELLPKSYDVVSDRLPLKTGGYGIYCGSCTEFYIRPLNPCVTDTDVLIYNTNELTFTKDCPVLPFDVSDLKETIDCYKTEPYPNYPGFVRIRALGKMSYSWKCKKYEFSHTSSPSRYATMKHSSADDLIKSSLGSLSESVHGPAITLQSTRGDPSQDTVKSGWCPQWPEEAQEWPKRRRDYGWPSTDTISEVLQSGCHVVYAQHRACRNDDLQWRLSFSVAEVILIQSWTPVQQIAYHLLRFFAKRELIHRDCSKEDEVLCPYHLKTLMLWACEEMSSEWWSSRSVLAICCELLIKLSEWFRRRYIPNYFIRKANLFHEPPSVEVLKKTERLLSDYCNCGILCHWFLEKYIQPVIETHIDAVNLQSLFEVRMELKSKDMDYLYAIGILLRHIPDRNRNKSERSFSFNGLKRNMDMLRRVKQVMLPVSEHFWCLTCYDTALLSLNAAYAFECGNILWDSKLFFDYVTEVSLKKNIVKCQFQNFPKPDTAEISQIQFLRALDFMANLSESESHSTFQLVSLISEECLKKTLECNDSQSNIIAPAALAYLAALHFAKSEYQIVIDICSAVLMCETTEKENETMNAGCLLFIGDVAGIVGFCVTWKMFNENLRNNMRHIYLDLRLTPKVFAHYLAVMSAERISKQLELNPDLPTSEFPLDQFFMVLTTQKSSTSTGIFRKGAKLCVYRRMDSLTAIAPLSVKSMILKEKLIDALTGHALEEITSFYNVIRKDYGIQCSTADCYRALYLYKCRQYDDALRLCDRILKEPELQSNLRELVLANVLLLPSLSSFFDGDVHYLLGFQTLVFHLSPVKEDDMVKRLFTDGPTLGIGLATFGSDFYTNSDQVPYSLPCPFSITYHYILGTHFVARYLKLKCCIDCNQLTLEAMAHVAAMKCNLPFEHIIRRFLLQKIRSFDK